MLPINCTVDSEVSRLHNFIGPLSRLHTLAAGTITALRSSWGILRTKDEAPAADVVCQAILDHAPVAIYVKDLSGRYILANRLCETHVGAPGSLIGKTDDDLLPPETVAALRTHDRAVLAAGGPLRREEVIPQPHGPRTYVEVKFPLYDAAGKAVAIGGISTDITELKQSTEALQRSEGRFRALVQHASDVIEVVGADGTVHYVSPASERVLGYAPAERVGQNIFAASLAHPDDIPQLRAMISDLVERPGESRRLEVRLRHRDGTWRDIEVTATNLLHDPGVGAFVGTYRDITECKAFEQQLRRQAFHDPLTGLANRALLSDRLEHALARAIRTGTPLAVLFLDLDRFKVINDSLGHATGDLLLVELGRRLRACLRPEDTIARLGGDEFTVLLEDVAGTADAERAAERILDTLRAPFAIADHEVVITTSIGIAVSTASQRDAGELLRAADLAMYRAKQTGKARYAVFEAGMASRALELLELEADLRRALERGELRIHYQPKVELDTGRLVALEALLRWEHPQHGLVPPDAFIPLAEETGLILPIERWALSEACRQAKAWQTMYPAAAALEVCVNLSAWHFQHPGLVAEIAEALDATGLNPRSLTLEITERAVMADAAANVATLHELKGLGVQLAVDDFGTGHSSLSYLHRFPVDILKIDRSFIDGLGRELEDTVIVRSVIGLGQSLGLVVVAEGVETPEQLAQLIALGCQQGQGYYFSRPLPSAEVDALLAQNG